jgi:hypothetical protein
MVRKDHRQSRPTLEAYLTGAISRSQLLKATGLGLVVAALPGAAAAEGSTPTGSLSFPTVPQVSGTYQPENLQDILNTLLTFEHFVVTYFSGVIAKASTLGLSALVKTSLQAVLAEEQYHADFLTGLGAQSVTDTYTIPPATMASEGAVLKTMELGETIGIASYLTALREFAQLGQPLLAQYAYQIGATEAEHRVLARGILAAGNDQASIPPANKAFETDLFLYLRDVSRLFQTLGFIGGTGTPSSYPGRAAALALAGTVTSSVIQKTPNTVTQSVGPTADFTASRGETFTTTMTGAAETPPGDPTGRGTARITLDPDHGQISFELRVSGIDLPALAAHIHKAPAGVEGPVVVPLVAPTYGVSSGTVSADPAIIRDIEANPDTYYVNVHNTPYPGGAVRGQL